MNKRRFLAACLSSLMTISSMVTPFLSVPVSALENSFTENGTSDIPISCEVSSGYTVSLPASIALSGDTGRSDFNVGSTYKAGVSGNIASDKYVIVTPTSLDSFVLTDSAGNRTVSPVVSQPDVSWSADELGTGDTMIDKDGNIFAQIDLAGSYSGEANFEFYLSDTDVTGIEESKQESRLQFSFENLNGSVTSEGDTIMLGAGEDLNIGLSATLDGEDVSSDVISYTSTNRNIYVDDSGELIVTKDAKPGESATITATVDESAVNTAKANAISSLLAKTGIVDSVFAADDISVSFIVTLVDINFDRVQLVDVNTIAMHPNDRITIKANVTPSSALQDLKWHKTNYSVSAIPNKVTKDVTVVTRDINFGEKFSIIATIGDFAKSIDVVIDHMYTDEDGFVETTDATCTADGNVTHICRKCGEEKVDIIPALGHNEVSANNAIAATCISAGKEADTVCSRCGIVVAEGATIPVTDHAWDNGTVITDSTCDQPGTKRYTCTVCKATKEENVDAVGHNYKAVVYEWAEDGSACTAIKECSRDASHRIEESGTITSVIKTPATCVEMGTRTYIANFTNPEFMTQNKDIKNIDTVDHDYEVTTVEPTSEEQGYDLHVCKVCGNEYKDNYTAKTHSFGTATYVWSSDHSMCIATRRCTDEGCNVVERETVDSVVEEITPENPTCANPGGTKYTATFTNAAFKAQTFMDENPMEHSYVTTVIAPTRTREGYDHHRCTVCGHVYLDNYTPVDRSYENNVAGVYDNNYNLLAPLTVEMVERDATSKEDNLLAQLKSEKNINSGDIYYIIIPEGTTKIGDYAFMGKDTIDDLYIPNTVTSIGKYAFSSMSEGGDNYFGYDDIWTKKLDLSNVESIGEYAFYGRRGINQDLYLNSIEYIGEKAFMQLYSSSDERKHGIKNLYVGPSCKSIGNYAFYFGFETTGNYYNCEIAGVDTIIGEKAFDYAFIDTLTVSCKNIPDKAFENRGGMLRVKNIILNNTVSIGASAFEYQNCPNISVQSTALKSIGERAFFDTEKLTTLDLSKTKITTIPNDAFCCSSIESILLPETVTSINYYAFGRCSNLSSINYLPNLETVDRAFDETNKLEEFIMSDTVTTWDDNELPCVKTLRVSSGLEIIYLSDCPSLETLVIPAGVKKIYNANSCSLLSSATFGDPNNWYTDSRYSSSSLVPASTLRDDTSAAEYLKTNKTELYYNGKCVKVVAKNGAAGYTGSYTNGGAKVTVTTPTSGYTIKYGTSSGNYTLSSIPTYKDVGKYYVYYQVTASGYSTASGYITITIAEKDAIKSVPTAKTGLEYTGSAQELINAGSVNSGTMRYGVSTSADTQPSAWSTTIPKETNAGTYYVWYKVDSPASSYTNPDPAYIPVTIEKATISVTSLSVTDALNKEIAPINNTYYLSKTGSIKIKANYDKAVEYRTVYGLTATGNTDIISGTYLPINVEGAYTGYLEGRYAKDGKMSLTIKAIIVDPNSSTIAENPNYVLKDNIITVDIECVSEDAPGLYDVNNVRLADLSYITVTKNFTANKNLPEYLGINPLDVYRAVLPVSIASDDEVDACVGDYAFYNCINLNEVSFASSDDITSVYFGTRAFYNDSKLSKVNGYFEKARHVYGASGIMLEDLVDKYLSHKNIVGKEAFYNCKALPNDGVLCYKDSTHRGIGFSEVGEDAFRNCTNLNTITTKCSKNSAHNLELWDTIKNMGMKSADDSLMIYKYDCRGDKSVCKESHEHDKLICAICTPNAYSDKKTHQEHIDSGILHDKECSICVIEYYFDLRDL